MKTNEKDLAKGWLEENSLWYRYKSKVWPQETEQAHSVHNIVRTLRSFHNLSQVVYLSVPITSGMKLYENLLAVPISREARYIATSPISSAEKYEIVPRLKGIMGRVISENYAMGFEVLEKLKEDISAPILFPADLFTRGEKWSQDDFQALWTTLIAEHASELVMCPGWEYSSGAVEELTHAFQLKLGIPKNFPGGFSPFFNTKLGEELARERMKNIAVFEPDRKAITIEPTLSKIDQAIAWISHHGFNAERLIEARRLLEWTGNKIEQGFYQ